MYPASHPFVILIPVKSSFFQLIVGKKLACYWCSGRKNYEVKNSSVQRALDAIV